MKSFAKRVIRSLGYELRRYAPTSSETSQLTTILRHHGVNVVFDIGANTGGFGHYLRTAGYGGRIVSFEPVQVAYDALLAATANDKHWSAAPRLAIGAEDGEVQMHVAGNSESSSILDMLDSHAVAAPSSTYVRTETVPLRRLDSLSLNYLRDDSRLFLKIDAQGYEEQVLTGGKDTVARALVIQSELSLVDLYAGQKLMPEMLEILKGSGFDLWGLSPVFADPRSGRMLQMDGIFCRTV